MCKLLMSLLILSGSWAWSTTRNSSNRSNFRKVVFIVFENENQSVVQKQKDFAHYASLGASLNNMTAEVHPSQGNYIALIAGSNLGVKSDANVDLNFNHVGDLLEKAGMKWRVYAEDFPGNCFTGAKSGNYARKHVPFISFKNVTGSASRCANIENESRFFTDLNSGSLPEYSMYIPNLKNDGHDTGVDFAGKWLSSKMGSLLENPDKLGDVLFVLTFDESQLFAAKNQVYTVLIGKNIKAGSVVTTATNHMSLLKLVEDEFGLGNLGRDDRTAGAITNIWK